MGTDKKLSDEDSLLSFLKHSYLAGAEAFVIQ